MASASIVNAALQQVRNLDTRTPPAQEYPSISSIPRTSPERISAARPKDALEDSMLQSSSPLVAPYLATDTVLYLAYGSNLSAETFLGVRGIRPISAVNVSVPTLRLTFDLPGIAYKEPCFANVAPRQLPKPPKLPPGLPDPPELPPRPPFLDLAACEKTAAHGDSKWDNGLIGVVYEVTAADYVTIVRTEGGGAAYEDVLVPCLAIPSRPPGIPEKPPIPELPQPFWAHTLYAPRIPTKPGDDDGNRNGNGKGKGKGIHEYETFDDDDDGDDDDCQSPIDRLKAWWRELLLSPIRPVPDYAQPSARYLHLIVDGAAEHELPVEYQRWLRTLQPYTITSRLQAVGQFLYLAFVTPMTFFLMTLGKMLADEDGRMPMWLALSMETFFHLAWMGYDRWFKPVFGDGERTEAGDDGARWDRGRRLVRRRRSRLDEEQASFLDGKPSH